MPHEGAETRTLKSVKPNSANSGKAFPITSFTSWRPYRGTVLMGSCVYFVFGVETRLVQTVKTCSSMPGSMRSSQIGSGWMVLEIGEL